MDKIAVGIDIGGTNMRGALVGENGDIMERRSVLSGAGKGIDYVMTNLAMLVVETISGKNIAGVGIGIPGIIDSARGIVTQAPNISNVDDYPIRDVLAEKLGSRIPVFIENDANCAAIGEWWLGAGKSVDSLVIITLGTGVGGGIILKGELWSGADGMAGEIGHITVFPDGAKCNCGNQGCLESYASASAIRRMVKEGLNDNNLETVLRKRSRGVLREKLPEIVMEAAIQGDEFALWIWDEVGKALGIGIANVVNLLNMEMVVIGGGLSNAFELFRDRSITEARKRGLRAPMRRVEVRRTVLGDDAGIIGAAYLALRQCVGTSGF
jgi:glucokinase